MEMDARLNVGTVYTCTENNVIMWLVNVHEDVTLVTKAIVVTKVLKFMFHSCIGQLLNMYEYKRVLKK